MDRESTLRERVQKLYRNSVLRFLVVGGLSFALDLGLLVVLHEEFGLDLVVATPIAFVVSLVFNYFLQRIFTFQSTNHHGISAAKYVSLVLFNIIVSDVIVTGFDAAGWSYIIGKGTATVLTTLWNYFLYREWIFKNKPATAENS
jgi:putative flippase GtrA